MSGSLLLQTSVAWLVVVACCVVVVELLFPSVIAPLARRAALAGGVATLLALCWLPALMATLLVAGCYAPWLLASVGWSHDHCETHGGHIHLCVRHAHASGTSVLAWLLFAAAVCWIARGAIELTRSVSRGIRIHRGLSALAEEDWRSPAVSVLDTETPLSLATGVWSPCIFVSRGLLAVLSPTQEHVLLEHERCHVRERHALLKLVAAIGAILLRKSTRRALLGDFALGCERRSDEAAAASVGDRLEVATTLLVGRRAAVDALPHGVMALEGIDGLEARVRMLTDAPKNRAVVLVGSAAVVLGVLGLITGHRLHHGVETLLSYFLF